LAILCGKQETDLFKPDDNGNWAGLNYETTKDDIENLLKNNKVLSFN
jgi:Holliday junction resolvase RusA-like endonuclease